MRSIFGRSVWYLAASVGSAAVSIAILPFATKVIGAEEYGALAIAVSAAGLVTAMASAAIGYVLAEYYLPALLEERKEIAGSALIAASGGAMISAALLLGVVEWVLPMIADIPFPVSAGIRLCVLGAVCSAPWVVFSELFMLEGRAVAFALGTVGQSLVNGMVVLLLLYEFSLSESALFIGFTAGQIVLTVAGFALFFRKLAWPKDFQWFGKMFSKSGAVGRAALVESGRTLLERSYMGAFASVSTVGLFSHSQLYRNSAMLTLNAVSRATWPVNLDEAQTKEPHFKVTRASWAVVQACIGGIAMVFALLGQDIISLLSSGKFVGATPMAVILLASLLIQTAGKSNMVVLIARGKGQLTANASAVGALAGIVAMLLLIPVFGAIGAAIAVVVQMLVARGLIIHASRAICRLPFADEWVLYGLGGTALLYIWKVLAEPGIVSSVMTLLVIAAVTVVGLRQHVRVFFKYRSEPTSPAMD